MAKTHSPRRRSKGEARSFEPVRLFLLLVPLVLAIMLLGNLHYGLLLAAGSAIFVGFFGWQAWSRHRVRPAPAARPGNKPR